MKFYLHNGGRFSGHGHPEKQLRIKAKEKGKGLKPFGGSFQYMEAGCKFNEDSYKKFLKRIMATF